MPGGVMRLTDRTVAGLALAADKVDRIHFDAELAGFGYRLRRGAGARMLRSWVVQYRHAGIVRRYLIGSAEAIGAERARVEARKMLAKVALGEDPQAARDDRRGRDRLTFRTIAAEYVAARAPALRPKTIRDLEWYLAGPHFRALHGSPLDRIGRREIAACLVVIERERGTPTALRARAALAAMYTWAMRSGLTDANPAANTPKPTIGRGRERVLSDDEVAAIWRAAGDDDYGRIVRLLILCAARRAEIGGLCWPSWTSTPAFGRSPRRGRRTGVRMRYRSYRRCAQSSTRCLSARRAIRSSASAAPAALPAGIKKSTSLIPNLVWRTGCYTTFAERRPRAWPNWG
jgi:hypothetical protein